MGSECPSGSFLWALLGGRCWRANWLRARGQSLQYRHFSFQLPQRRRLRSRWRIRRRQSGRISVLLVNGRERVRCRKHTCWLLLVWKHAQVHRLRRAMLSGSQYSIRDSSIRGVCWLVVSLVSYAKIETNIWEYCTTNLNRPESQYNKYSKLTIFISC